MPAARSPAKLEDCEVHGADSGAELFVVEGDSAALAVARVRDPRMQAVLPMQGKPLNPLRASAGRILEHRFYGALLAALGVALGGDSARINEGLRYARVLLLMDPDADGIHCGALLMMFFHRWLPEMLETGRVSMVRAPVGEVTDHASGTVQLAFSDAQFQSLCRERRGRGEGSFTALRYRGLGNIDPAVLERTCVHPGTRNSHVLSTADARIAMEVFASLRDVPTQRPLL